MMTSEQFCYWLQGFMELSGEGASLTPAQTKMVREHLALVFRKVTPPLEQVPGTPWPGFPNVVLTPAVTPTPAPVSPLRVGEPDWTLQPTTTCQTGGVLGVSDRSGTVSWC